MKPIPIPLKLTHLESSYGCESGGDCLGRVQNGIAQIFIPGIGWFWNNHYEGIMSWGENWCWMKKKDVLAWAAEQNAEHEKGLDDQLALALKIATECHKGQKDKAGVDYINHPVTVSDLCEHKTCKCAAMLHDVIEDCGETVESLVKRGIREDIANLTDWLTRKSGQSYDEYIEEIADNSFGREVKMADLTHNMDLGRLPHPTEKDFQRVEKYRKAFEYLKARHF